MTRRGRRAFIAALWTGLVAACATSGAGAAPGPYTKLLVLTVGYRYAVRQRLEDALVGQLRSGVTDAIASHIVLPPGVDPTRAELDRAVQGHRCDGVLTVQVVAVGSAAAPDPSTAGVEVQARLTDTRTGTAVWTTRQRIAEGSTMDSAIRTLSEAFSAALRRDDVIA